MSAKDWLIIAGAAAAVYIMLKSAGASAGPLDWVQRQGNTGYPDEAYTGIPAIGGGVWV